MLKIMNGNKYKKIHIDSMKITFGNQLVLNYTFGKQLVCNFLNKGGISLLLS